MPWVVRRFEVCQYLPSLRWDRGLNACSELDVFVLLAAVTASHAQDRVTINQWSTTPPQNLNILPIPCPCFQTYTATKGITINACPVPIAGLVVRFPDQGGQPPGPLLAAAPNKEFATFSLGPNEYLSLDISPTMLFGFAHVSCPANPTFIPSNGTPRCVAPRFAQPSVVCKKDPAANVGDQCACVHAGQSFDGKVAAVPPSPLD